MICPTCGKESRATAPHPIHTCHDPVMEAMGHLKPLIYDHGSIGILFDAVVAAHQAQLQRFWDRINEINRA